MNELKRAAKNYEEYLKKNGMSDELQEIKTNYYNNLREYVRHLTYAIHNSTRNLFQRTAPLKDVICPSCGYIFLQEEKKELMEEFRSQIRVKCYQCGAEIEVLKIVTTAFSCRVIMK